MAALGAIAAISASRTLLLSRFSTANGSDFSLYSSTSGRFGTIHVGHGVGLKGRALSAKYCGSMLGQARSSRVSVPSRTHTPWRGPAPHRHSIVMSRPQTASTRKKAQSISCPKNKQKKAPLLRHTPTGGQHRAPSARRAPRNTHPQQYISLVGQNHVLEPRRGLHLRRRRCCRGTPGGSGSSRFVHGGGRGGSGGCGGRGGRSLGDRVQRNGGPFANLQFFFLQGKSWQCWKRESRRGGWEATTGAERGGGVNVRVILQVGIFSSSGGFRSPLEKMWPRGEWCSTPDSTLCIFV